MPHMDEHRAHDAQVTLADLAPALPLRCAACELQLDGAWVWCDGCSRKVHERCIHQRVPFRAVILGSEIVADDKLCRACSRDA